MLSYSLLLQLVRAMSKENPDLADFGTHEKFTPVPHQNILGGSYIVGIAVKHHGFASLPHGLLNPTSVSQSAYATCTNNADSPARI